MRWARLLLAMVLLVSVTVAATAVSGPPAVAQSTGDGLYIFVTDSRGAPLQGASVEIGGQAATTDAWGRSLIDEAEAGPVVVSHPRFPSRRVDWTDRGDRLVVPLGAPVLRAIHVSGNLPGTARWDELVALAGRTSVNSFMLDLKDESGRVFGTTNSSWAIAAGADLNRWDLAQVTDELHRDGIAVIARIVAFQDPVAGNALPHLAVKTTSGEVFTRRSQTFLDPTDPDAREYALQLAEEACAAGVDEVQFDYVRFPDGDKSSLVFDGGSSEAVRVDTISGFLLEAKERVLSGCAVAADVFGFVTSIEGDGGLGQQIDAIARSVDVVSPMAYPNHWSSGWFGFDDPAANPGGVIDASMRDAIRRVGGVSTIRPWLQDFGGYGPAEVRAQIEAADRLGLGWMLWNAGSIFTETGIPGDSEIFTSGPLADPYEEFLPPSGYWDVPSTSTFSGDVAWLGDEGFTRGCNPPWRDNFCPARSLTRGEAAALIVRALGLAPSDVDRFDDDQHSTHQDDINALAAAEITYGCGPRRYCPDELLTREQMASLLARALDLPASRADTFGDDDGSTHEPDIERLAAARITTGCGPTAFCPTRDLRRDEAAAFLHRALG